MSKGLRFGIGARVFLAFGGIVAGTVASGIAASVMLSQIGGHVRQIGSENLPEVVKSLGLILGFGVVAPRSGDQGTDERGEKLFAPFACIVNELEEPEIDRQLLLGNAPMGS